jgi:hypothetical protein
MSLHGEAEALAEIILQLARKAPKNKIKFLKLPPVFTAINHSKYGNGFANLVAIIKCSSDYEDIESNLKLNDIVDRYNYYGGLPKLSEQDLRKVHNWLQLINFALRAAVLEQTEKTGLYNESKIVELTINKLFNSDITKRSFVAHAPDSKYEIKPLKYADTKTITKWLANELNDKNNGKFPYGYEPSSREWQLYGLRGQSKTAYSSLVKDIQELVIKARSFDESGDHKQADMIYEKLVNMQKSLEQIHLMLAN